MLVETAPLILSVVITPNPIHTGVTFRLAVEVQECNHERLVKYTHEQLTAYTHLELATQKLQ